MTIDLTSFTLGGFAPGMSLINRTLEGLWSSTAAFFINFDYPLTSVIQARSLNSTVQNRVLVSELDQ